MRKTGDSLTYGREMLKKYRSRRNSPAKDLPSFSSMSPIAKTGEEEHSIREDPASVSTSMQWEENPLNMQKGLRVLRMMTARKQDRSKMVAFREWKRSVRMDEENKVRSLHRMKSFIKRKMQDKLAHAFLTWKQYAIQRERMERWLSEETTPTDSRTTSFSKSSLRSNSVRGSPLRGSPPVAEISRNLAKTNKNNWNRWNDAFADEKNIAKLEDAFISWKKKAQGCRQPRIRSEVLREAVQKQEQLEAVLDHCCKLELTDGLRVLQHLLDSKITYTTLRCWGRWKHLYLRELGCKKGVSVLATTLRRMQNTRVLAAWLRWHSFLKSSTQQACATRLLMNILLGWAHRDQQRAWATWLALMRAEREQELMQLNGAQRLKVLLMKPSQANMHRGFRRWQKCAAVANSHERGMRKMHQVVGRLHNRKLSDGLRQWRDGAWHNQHRSQALARTVRHLRSRILSKGWQSWANVVQKERDREEKTWTVLGSVVGRLQHRLLSLGFSTWKELFIDAVAEDHMKARLLKLLLHKEARQIKAAVRLWRAEIADARALEDLLRRAIQLLGSRLEVGLEKWAAGALMRAWMTWCWRVRLEHHMTGFVPKDEALDSQAAAKQKAYAAALLRTYFGANRSRRQLAMAWRTWCDNVHVGKSQGEGMSKMKKICGRILHNALSKGFSKWKGDVEASRKAEQEMRKALAYLANALLSHGWKSWVTAHKSEVAREKALLAKKTEMEQSASTGFHLLTSLVRHRQKDYKVHALAKWKVALASLDNEKEALERLIHHAKNLALWGGWNTWHACIKELQEEEQDKESMVKMLQLGFGACFRFRMKLVLFQWNQACVFIKALEALARISGESNRKLDDYLLRRSLARWRRASTCLFQQSVAVKAMAQVVNKGECRLKQKGVASWKLQATAQKAADQALMENAGALLGTLERFFKQSTQKSLFRAFMTWRCHQYQSKLDQKDADAASSIASSQGAALAARQRAALEMIKNLLGNSEKKKSYLAIRRWKGLLHVGAQQMLAAQKLQKVLLKMQQSKKAKAMYTWHHNCALAKAEDEMKKAVLLRAHYLALWKPWYTWVKKVKIQRKIEKAGLSVKKVLLRLQHKILHAGLQTWADNCQKMKFDSLLKDSSQKAAVCSMMNGVVSKFLHRQRNRAMCTWKRFVVNQKQQEFDNFRDSNKGRTMFLTLSNILRRVQGQKLQWVWMTWAELVRHAKNEQAYLASLTMLQNQVQGEMSDTRRKHAVQIFQKFLLVKGKGLLLKGMNTWKRNVGQDNQAQLAASLMKRVLGKIIHRNLSAAFHQWESFLFALEKEELALSKVFAALNHRLLLAGWNSWQQHVEMERAAHEAFEDAVKSIFYGVSILLMRKSLYLWHNKAEDFLRVHEGVSTLEKACRRMLRLKLHQAFHKFLGNVWSQKFAYLYGKSEKILDNLLAKAAVSIFRSRALRMKREGWLKWNGMARSQKIEDQKQKQMQKILNNVFSNMKTRNVKGAFRKWAVFTLTETTHLLRNEDNSKHQEEVNALQKKFQQQHALRLMQMILNGSYSKSLLRGLRKWKRAVDQQKNLQLGTSLMHKALTKLRHRELAKGADGWKHNVIAQKEMEKKLTKAIAKMQKSQLAKGLNAWTEQHDAEKKEMDELMNLIGKLDGMGNKFKKLKTHMMFNKWNDAVLKSSAAEDGSKLLYKALCRLQKKNLQKAMRKWTEFSRARNQEEATLMRMLRHFAQRQLVAAWNSWHDSLEHYKDTWTKLLEGLWGISSTMNKIQMRHAFLEWSGNTADLQLQEMAVDKLENTLRRMLRIRLFRGLHRLKEAAREAWWAEVTQAQLLLQMKSGLQALDALLAGNDFNLLNLRFKRWLMASKDYSHKDLRAQTLKKVIGTMKSKQLAQAFKTWLKCFWFLRLEDQYLAEFSQYERDRDAELALLKQSEGVRMAKHLLSNSDNKHLFKAFRKWHQNVLGQKGAEQAAKLMKRTAQTLARRNLAKGWNSWVQYVKWRQHNELTMAKAIKSALELQLSRAWNQWKVATDKTRGEAIVANFLKQYDEGHRKAAVGRAFAMWNEATLTGFMHDSGVQAIAKTLMLSGLRAQRRAFVTWACALRSCQMDQNRAKLLAKAVNHVLGAHRKQNMATAWTTWRWYAHLLEVQATERFASQLQRFGAAFMHLTQRGAAMKTQDALKRWQHQVALACNKEGGASRLSKTILGLQNRSLARALRTWETGSAKRRHAEEVMKRALCRMEKFAKSSGWNTWTAIILATKEKEKRRLRALQLMDQFLKRMKARQLYLGFASWKKFLWLQEQMRAKLSMIVKIMTNKSANMLAKGWRTWAMWMSAERTADMLTVQQEVLLLDRLMRVAGQQSAVALAQAWAAWRYWLLLSFEREIAAERSEIVASSSKVQEGLRVLQYVYQKNCGDQKRYAFYNWRHVVQTSQKEDTKMKKLKLLLVRNCKAYERMIVRKRFQCLAKATSFQKHAILFKATHDMLAPFMDDKVHLKATSRAWMCWCLYVNMLKMEDDKRNTTETMEQELARSLKDARSETMMRSLRYLFSGWWRRALVQAVRQWKVAADLKDSQTHAFVTFLAVAKRTDGYKLQQAFLHWKEVFYKGQSKEVALLIQTLRNGQGAKALVALFSKYSLFMLSRGFRQWKDVLDSDAERALRHSLQMDLVRRKQLDKILKTPQYPPRRLLARPASVIAKRQHSLRMVVLHAMKRGSYTSQTEDLQWALNKWYQVYLQF